MLIHTRGEKRDARVTTRGVYQHNVNPIHTNKKGALSLQRLLAYQDRRFKCRHIPPGADPEPAHPCMNYENKAVSVLRMIVNPCGVGWAQPVVYCVLEVEVATLVLAPPTAAS
jgi:hypothetical protein